MGTQLEVNGCARRKFQAADATLSIAYGSVMERLSTEKRAVLRREHRAWLASRDPVCKSKLRQAEGGSTWELEFYSCLEVSTRRRTEEVKASMERAVQDTRGPSR